MTSGKPEAPRRLTILGSTGSIGTSTMALLEAAEPGEFAVEALVAGRDAEGLAKQAIRFGARLAVVADPASYAALQAALAGTGIECAAGPEAVIAAAARPVDWTMAAIVGAAGLQPTLAALSHGGTVALANKESLVCAGPIVLAAAKAHGALLLPVDSEHNAIFQALDNSDPSLIEKIIITASGGPFRTADISVMRSATPEMAVKHPMWSMGAKISVDSATMMNKGLEVIEAERLFPVHESQLEVLVHPQSTVHGLVQYADGSLLAQLGAPDMRTPISHALGWPRRMKVAMARLDLAKLGSLTFEAPDPVRFPALRLAREALIAGQGAPCILNAANEAAVALFLARRLGFLDIATVVEETLQRLGAPAVDGLDDVIALDTAARAEAHRLAALRVLA